MFPGETVLTGAPKICQDCNTEVEFKVMTNGLAYYVGTECACGPYSRETGYIPTRQEAEKALELINDGDIHNPEARVRMPG